MRPNSLKDFTGQGRLKRHLSMLITSSKKRNINFPHLLLTGNPGSGKTTIAHILSKEMGSSLKVVLGESIKTDADLAFLISAKDNDVIFIDEIHSMSKGVMETLYPILEDNIYYLKNGRKFTFPKFTLIGATTEAGLLPKPLVDRFKVKEYIDKYTYADMYNLISNVAKGVKLNISKNAVYRLAKISRFTPRIALNLIDGVLNYSIANGIKYVTNKDVLDYMTILDIDTNGLTTLDRKYLHTLYYVCDNKPAGVKTMSNILYENILTIEKSVEPFLLSSNYIRITAKGRALTDKGITFVRG